MTNAILTTVIGQGNTLFTKASDLTRLYNDRFGPLGDWVFRGQPNSKYGLKTSLERAVLAYVLSAREPTPEQEGSALSGVIGDTDSGAGRLTVFDLEGGLMRRFRRQCQHYVSSPPSTPLEVLALMQHYSAPTRLQDWTYSFHVATFFAITSSTPQSSERCAVWALDINWFRNRFEAKQPDLFEITDEDRNFQKDRHSFEKVFRQERRFVCPVNPYYLNDRLLIQQGVFLCPGSVGSRFEDNLIALQYDEIDRECIPVRGAEEHLVKIEISTAPSTRTDILRDLGRMNISNATLFPGLQGFARSLEDALAFSHTLAYGDKYENDFPLGDSQRDYPA